MTREIIAGQPDHAALIADGYALRIVWDGFGERGYEKTVRGVTYTIYSAYGPYETQDDEDPAPGPLGEYDMSRVMVVRDVITPVQPLPGYANLEGLVEVEQLYLIRGTNPQTAMEIVNYYIGQID